MSVFSTYFMPFLSTLKLFATDWTAWKSDFFILHCLISDRPTISTFIFYFHSNNNNIYKQSITNTKKMLLLGHLFTIKAFFNQ